MSRTKIKICGITNVDDAMLAAREGAEMIGMILWKGSKRFVSLETAKEIALTAKSMGATPVAVFVDQRIDEIKEICTHIKVDTIQLHGPIVKLHLHALSLDYTSLFAVSVTKDGSVDPTDECLLEDAKNSADYLLFDHAQGGTGRPFCWDRFRPPKGIKWFLAGGINPENVLDALKLNPSGIDVASGVEQAGTVVKNPISIKNLIAKVREYDEAK